MWNKHKWKRSLAFIMAVCLIAGFSQSGIVCAEDTVKAVTETRQERLEQEPEEQPVQRPEEQGQVEEVRKEGEESEEKPEEIAPEERPSEKITNEEEQPEEILDEGQKNTEEPQAEKEVPAEAPVQENLEPEMPIKQLKAMVKNSTVVENESVNVKIYNNDVVTDGTIHTGYIADNVPKNIEGSHFVGAYVVTASGEDEISYVGSFSDSDGSTVIYYALADGDGSTGMELKTDEGQYIKLVYKTTCNIRYEVRLEDGTEVSDGGTFYDKRDGIDYGTNLRIQFKANQNEGADYLLVSIKATGADGKETKIDIDSDGYGYLNTVKQNMTITAQVRKIEQYKLVVDEATGGHVCWAGHGDETDANTKDPYSVAPEKFCSYRQSDGATVTAAPGKTIYFVLYSQAWTSGGVWEFKNLTLNGKPLDMVYDGEVYKTSLGNGMTACIRYCGPAKDSHLKGEGSWLGIASQPPREKERCKYECWIENVHEDIHVKFENADMKNHEIVRLAEKEGINEICASTFDRQAVGGDYFKLGKHNLTRFLPKVGHYDFWKKLYEPVTQVGADITNVKYEGNSYFGIVGEPLPDAPYAQSFWGEWEWSHFYSDYAHVEMQSRVFVDSAAADADRQTLEWGSRYIYFKTKPGYDPRTLDAQITGKDEGSESGRTRVKDVGSIFDLRSDAINSVVYKANNNRSMYLAKNKGYMWYLRYEGAGINVRNLYLNCNPYQYGVEYDLNGGTIDGNETYEDSNKYTIESGKNRISLPSQTPHKDGCVFDGWKLVEVAPENAVDQNGEAIDYKTEYDPLKGVKTDYHANDVFTINSSNYKAGLATAREEYDIVVDEGGLYGGYVTYHYTDYIPKTDGNHRFRFVAQWVDGDDPSTEKAEYFVRVYKETAPETEGAVEVDGRTYMLEEKSHVGIKGEDIISIQRTPEGYVLDQEKSVVRLRNFMMDGNKENEIAYYFRMPEWKISQVSDPEGGVSEKEPGKVKIRDEILYTLQVENQEKATIVLQKGTVITGVLPAEGTGSPVNRKSEGFDFYYQGNPKTVTYTLKEPREMKAGEKLELKYSVKVEDGVLMENQAKMQVDWKVYETESLYHITSADLTISNTLKGDYADYTKDFEVTIKLTDADGKPFTDKRVEYQGGQLSVQGANKAPSAGSAVLNENNEITLKLKHGQTVILKNLPYGCHYSVVQKEEKGYVTTYGGVTGQNYQGTGLPIVTGVWPSPEEFADEYELLTLNPSGIFEYDGEYFAVSRKFRLNRAQAESGPDGKGPDGQTNGWFGVVKLTGKVWNMEEGAERISGLTRGDLVKYKDNYYIFNTGGEWGCNPEKDTGTPPQYHNVSKAGAQNELWKDKNVDITNTYEKVSPTGIEAGNGRNSVAMCFAIVLMGCAVTGCSVRYKKGKKNM